jgi:hypothetical protein
MKSAKHLKEETSDAFLLSHVSLFLLFRHPDAVSRNRCAHD